MSLGNCRSVLLCWIIGSQLVSAQAPPTFDVVSVKLTNPDHQFTQLNCSGGAGFVAENQTLLSLILWAYDLPFDTHRTSGGPNWINSPGSAFDVQGKAERKVSFSDCRLMVQSLLADRFKVSFHWETRVIPVYLLLPGSKGPKLHEVDKDPGVVNSVTINGAKLQFGNGFQTTASGRGISMQQLTRYLGTVPSVGIPVIDKTELNGFYGFSLDFAVTLSDDNHPDIFAALREQLGLKLEAAKAPVKILVIDHAERPSEN